LSLIDTDVQVATLTVFGSIVAVDPGTPEITDIICKSSATHSGQEACDTSSQANSVQDDSNEDITYVPVHSDNADMSWLLEVCLKNLQQPSVNEGVRTLMVHDGPGLLPCPPTVRIESQQVLTVLARKYFTQVVNRHLEQIIQLLGWTLIDSNVNICLHSGRVIEALGSSLWQCLQDQGKY
jgi:hypothetical protein